MANTPPQTLLKADKLSIVLAADKDGKIRLNCASWEDAKVLLPDQVLEVRWQAGQVALIRRDASSPNFNPEGTTMAIENFDPAHLPTYIREAVGRVHRRFTDVENVAKSELVTMLGEIAGLVHQLPDDGAVIEQKAVELLPAPPFPAFDVEAFKAEVLGNVNALRAQAAATEKGLREEVASLTSQLEAALKPATNTAAIGADAALAASLTAEAKAADPELSAPKAAAIAPEAASVASEPAPGAPAPQPEASAPAAQPNGTGESPAPAAAVEAQPAQNTAA